MRSTESAISRDAKVFWSFVNNIRNKNSSPSCIRAGNVLVEDDLAIANSFADYFESVYARDSSTRVDFAYESDLNLTNIDIGIGEVFAYVNGLDTGASPGIDGIPPIFFKSCNFIMARLLWLIFCKSLSCGTFPSAWKTCIVTPIFKGGDETLTSNYRPISKQCIMPKIFENIITLKLSQLLKNIIINEQHGFVNSRSTTTNLILYHDYIVTALEEGLQVDAVYTNFSRAFDSVNHAILVSKLHALGVGGGLLEWLASFISDRSQIVKLNNLFS